MTKNNNGFILFSRFDNNDEKTNDEAIRYDQIKKIYICGTGEGVFIDTYDNHQYHIKTNGIAKSNIIFWEIVRFGTLSTPYLNYIKFENLEE